MFEATLSSEPLDVNAVLSRAADPSCGAIASFLGTVRESGVSDSTAPVVALEYEAADDLARAALERNCIEAAERYGLARAIAVHRTGRCSLGEPTVIIACSAPHRAEALEACRFVIEAVKAEVPIWKKEIYADSSTWVGRGS
jgi:molybdopterin synthase catalytic subunit